MRWQILFPAALAVSGVIPGLTALSSHGSSQGNGERAVEAEDRGATALGSSAEERTMPSGGSATAANTTTAESLKKRKDPVGLSLWFQDGEVRNQDLSAKTTKLIDGYPRYIQELDITASVTTTTDQGITPLAQQGDLADLDWSGVEAVDESWRPTTDGTTNLIRQRFYRKARWMTRESAFSILPLDQHDHVVGPAIFANSGTDDKWRATDDGFIRRYVARQVTLGCTPVAGTAIGDCSHATSFTAEGLVQFRDAQHPELWARQIPKEASQLGVVWSEDIRHVRKAPVTHVERKDVQWGYGFIPKIEVSNPPANGQFYVRGEQLVLHLTFTDADGNLFFRPGMMPPYEAFLSDAMPTGLRYYDGFREDLELYYALKHREANMLVDVAGPTDALKYAAVSQPSLNDLFAPQTVFADADLDGYTSIATLQPPGVAEVVDPSMDVSDTINFTVPANAKPGTYVVTFKARRDYGGEALNRTSATEIQVGQAAVSAGPKFNTGNCNSCHKGESSFAKILHGTDDARLCFGCHSQLGFEPNHALDCRVHKIHSRSNRFPADFNNCSTCHLDKPTGPARCEDGDILPGQASTP